LEQVAGAEERLQAQDAVRTIHVSPAVKRYIVEITNQTRKHPSVYLGASPRGSLTLHRAGQARAAMLGRDYVLPDDVKALALAALAHRVILGPSARLKEVTAEAIVQEILKQLPVPGGDAR
jgi:MoxR-like ATPase